MKNFVLGILVCGVFYGSAAKALEVSLNQITVEEFFTGCALAGSVARYGVDLTLAAHANYSVSLANEVVKRRRK